MLCQTHLADDGWGTSNPNLVAINSVNASLNPNDTPYSADLIQLLEQFEFPGSSNGASLENGTYVDADGVQQKNYRSLPRPRWIVNDMLPQVRRKVREHRGIGKSLPDGYFRNLDVSWTRPDNIMPYW